MTTDRNSEGAACHRLHTPGGKWQWMDGPPSQQALDDSRNFGWTMEYAYTTPPASIPAAEVQALVERWETVRQFASGEDFDRWEEMAKGGHVPSDEGNAYADKRADELAKLIPRGTP